MVALPVKTCSVGTSLNMVTDKSTPRADGFGIPHLVEYTFGHRSKSQCGSPSIRNSVMIQTRYSGLPNLMKVSGVSLHLVELKVFFTSRISFPPCVHL